MKSYWADELNLKYDDYKKLHLDGKCNLGIPNDVAQQISDMKLNPKGSGTGMAMKFWNFAGFAAFGYSIYLSFTWEWWAFIPGFFVMGFIFNVNKKSKGENVLNDALNNEEFYNKLMTINNIRVQIDEEEAKKFLKNK